MVVVVEEEEEKQNSKFADRREGEGEQLAFGEGLAPSYSLASTLNTSTDTCARVHPPG